MSAADESKIDAILKAAYYRRAKTRAPRSPRDPARERIHSGRARRRTLGGEIREWLKRQQLVQLHQQEGAAQRLQARQPRGPLHGHQAQRPAHDGPTFHAHRRRLHAWTWPLRDRTADHRSPAEQTDQFPSYWATGTARSSRTPRWLREHNQRRWRCGTSTPTASWTWPSVTGPGIRLQVMLGNGDGTFQAPVAYDLRHGAWAAAGGGGGRGKMELGRGGLPVCCLRVLGAGARAFSTCR